MSLCTTGQGRLKQLGDHTVRNQIWPMIGVIKCVPVYGGKGLGLFGSRLINDLFCLFLHLPGIAFLQNDDQN